LVDNDAFPEYWADMIKVDGDDDSVNGKPERGSTNGKNKYWQNVVAEEPSQ